MKINPNIDIGSLMRTYAMYYFTLQLFFATSFAEMKMVGIIGYTLCLY